MEGQSPAGISEAQLQDAEAKVEGGAQAETKPDSLSPRFAALAKREKSLVLMRQEMAAEKAKFEAERKAFLEERTKHMSLYEQAKKDPRAILQEVGWDYDRLTQAHLNDYKPTADDKVSALEQKLQALEAEKAKETEAAKARELELQRQAFNDQVNQAKKAIKAEIEGMGDEFELVNSFGEHELVYQTMMEHFNKTGKVLEIKEAAQMVEKYIEEAELERLAKTKKFQSRFQPKEEPKDQTPAGSKPSVTLTHTQTASPMGFTGPKTEAERMQRALAALERKS